MAETDTVSLKYWKGRVTKFVDFRARHDPTIKSYEEPFEFPTTADALAEYIKKHQTKIKILETSLNKDEERLSGLANDGLTLMENSKIPEVNKAEVSKAFQEYLDKIHAMQQTIYTQMEVVTLRKVELEEQQSLISPGSSTFRSSTRPAVAVDGDDSDDQSIRSGGGARCNRPRQQLPRFKGDVKKWPSFWAGYSAMVHDSKELSDLDKFFYLRQALRDAPLHLVEEIPVTEANYTKAVSLLKNRYDLGATLTQVMIAEIQQLPPASTSTKEVRTTLEALRQKMVTLECHGEKFQDSNVWKSLILSKFPTTVNSHAIKQEKRLPKEADGSSKTFNAMELLEEIADYVQLMEQIELNVEAHKSRRPGNAQSETKTHPPKGSNRDHGRSQPNRGEKRSRKCLCQSEDHWIKDCPKFTTAAARKQEARRLGCCI